MAEYVRLEPCVEHSLRERRELVCFHNLGGAYEVVRRLARGSILLLHVEKDCLGLAQERDLHIAPPG